MVAWIPLKQKRIYGQIENDDDGYHHRPDTSVDTHIDSPDILDKTASYCGYNNDIVAAGLEDKQKCQKSPPTRLTVTYNNFSNDFINSDRYRFQHKYRKGKNTKLCQKRYLSIQIAHHGKLCQDEQLEIVQHICKRTGF